jgi:hypothetical protein
LVLILKNFGQFVKQVGFRQMNLKEDNPLQQKDYKKGPPGLKLHLSCRKKINIRKIPIF